jgi:acyl-CoA synthetase (AMP-forming)/AMP-acid ligase II
MSSNETHGTLSKIFRSSFPDAERTGFRTEAWRSGVARSAEELKPLHRTMLHAFATAAKLDDKTGITLMPEDDDGKEEHTSYRRLYHKAIKLAGALAARGVKKGDRVLIVLPTSFDFVVMFFASELVGAIPVPSYPPAALEKVEQAIDRLCHIAHHAGAAWVVSSRELVLLLGEIALHVRSVRALVPFEDLDERGRAADAPKPRAVADDPAFIQYTSGSTGRPKGVLLVHENLVSNIHAIGQAARIGRKDVVVSWLPLYHDMGLIGALLFSIYWRLPLVLMPPTAFLMKPSRWLWAIHRHRGTLSPAPNFGYALAVKRIRPSEREGLDLSCWRVAFNGAEPVNVRTIVDFQRAFEPFGFPKHAMLPVYGLAESSLAVTFPDPWEPLRFEVVDRAALAAGRAVDAGGAGSTAIVSVGRAVPGHQVVVVDEHGTPVREREVGHIVVRGPSVMQGYFRDDDATSQVMVDGWLWTGDLGYVSHGELFVTGRAKDLIIVRGKNHYAEDLEAVAERVEGVRAGGTAAFGIYDEAKAQDLVVMVCETKYEKESARLALVENVGSTVNQYCGIHVDEVVLVPPGTIPKTSSGKRQRALCRELYLRDELGKNQTGKLRLALVFARSGAGFLAAKARQLLKRRAPD